MPIGAHTLLSFLAEPLKQLSESSDSLEDYNVSQNLEEFHDWVCFIFVPLSLSLSPINLHNLLGCYPIPVKFYINMGIESLFILNRVSIILVMQNIAIGSKLN